MRILSIIGARPQFVKAAMVSREIARHEDMHEILVHTGQHFDHNMSHLFFEEMGLREPDYNLGIHSMSHETMVAKMGDQLDDIIRAQQPDWVLVYGDTDSTLSGARAACRSHVPLCHVEAGLRSFNPAMQEEYNRIETDKVSDLLFVPTASAIRNLLNEGVPAQRIFPTGDVMKDAAVHFAAVARAPQQTVPDNFILCTLHRAENVDDSEILTGILRTLETISHRTPVVLPLHPRTRQKLQSMDFEFSNSSICFIDPVGYLEMLYMLQHALLVMTDSGGLQKEAYFFQKYCVTLREETEWIELCERGCNRLVGHDAEKILKAVNDFLQMKPFLENDLYGDGHTARQIVDALRATTI